MSLKIAYRNWYEAGYLKLIDELEKSNISSAPIKALLSQIELAALEEYDQEVKRSFREKLKWLMIHLFVKQKITYSFEKSQLEEGVDILFWPTQVKHYVLHSPVCAKLKEMNVKVALASFSDKIEKRATQDELDFIRIAAKKKFSFKFRRIYNVIRILSIAKRVQPFVLESRVINFNKLVYSAFKYLNEYQQNKEVYYFFANNLKAKLIVIGYELSLQSRTINALAKTDNISTAAIQVGRLHYPMTKYTGVRYYYLYGRKSKEYLTKFADPFTQAIVAGSLKMEKFSNIEPPTVIKDLTSNFRRGSRSLVLMAFTGPGVAVSMRGHVANLKVVKSIIEIHKDLFFIFKLNTKDDIKYYKDITAFSNVFLIDDRHELFQYDIIHWIKLSDVVVTGVSTSCLQALGMSKPVISLDVEKELADNLLLQEEAILYATNEKEFSACINYLCDAELYQKKIEQAKEFIELYFEEHSISSVDFIADSMMEIANDYPSPIPVSARVLYDEN